MGRQDLLELAQRHRIVAVLRLEDGKKLSSILESLISGGIRLIEITMTTPSALTLVAECKRNWTGNQEVRIGAGTVLDEMAARQAVEAGADFIVSPITDTKMIRLCNQLDIPVAAGAFTPTEIYRAWQCGADIVKLFPATSVGPGFIADILAPLPRIRLMPTGGVSEKNAADFIGKGAFCLGVGSALVHKDLVAEANWLGLTQRARELVRASGGKG